MGRQVIEHSLLGRTAIVLVEKTNPKYNPNLPYDWKTNSSQISVQVRGVVKIVTAHNGQAYLHVLTDEGRLVRGPADTAQIADRIEPPLRGYAPVIDGGALSPDLDRIFAVPAPPSMRLTARLVAALIAWEREDNGDVYNTDIENELLEAAEAAGISFDGTTTKAECTCQVRTTTCTEHP